MSQASSKRSGFTSESLAAVKDCICRDVHALFSIHAAGGSTRLKDFCEVWTRLDFGLIHATCPPQISRRWFLDIVAGYAQDRLFVPGPDQAKFGVIFFCEAVYVSQPFAAARRLPIKVSERIWAELLRLHGVAERGGLADVVGSMRRLVCQNAFMFVARTPHEMEAGQVERVDLGRQEHLSEDRFDDEDHSRQELFESSLRTLRTVGGTYDRLKSIDGEFGLVRPVGPLVEELRALDASYPASRQRSRPPRTSPGRLIARPSTAPPTVPSQRIEDMPSLLPNLI